MVFINRQNDIIPEYFYSTEIKDEIDKKIQHYSILNIERLQYSIGRFFFPSKINVELSNTFHNKCAFCESSFTKNLIQSNKSKELTKGLLGIKDYIDSKGFIEHFRPKVNARNLDGDEIAYDAYWWLEYQWFNLYLICNQCSRSKSNFFPVEGKRLKETNPKKIFNSFSEYLNYINKEKNILIDPCIDEPSQHFFYNIETGEIVGATERANTTIEVFRLNRKDLVYRRRRVFIQEEEIRKKKGHRKVKETEEFSGAKLFFWKFKRNLIQSQLVDKSYIEDSLKENEVKNENQSSVSSIEKPSSSVKNQSKKPTKIKRIQLDRLELKNFKCFEKLIINFKTGLIEQEGESEPWLVFLGENGVGKSSLLKAIGIALMGQEYIDSLNFDVKELLTYGKRKGFIKVSGSEIDEEYEVRYNKKEGIVSNVKTAPTHLIGYGSTRLLPKKSLKPEENTKYVKLKNLFDYSTSLSDAKKWLLEIEDVKLFQKVAKSLRSLMLLGDKDEVKRDIKEKEIYVEYNSGQRISLNDLSDGYRSVFALSIDIIKSLSIDNKVFENAEGIVLIDEIGTHLHPRWKMEVIKKLKTTFPKIQFIVTTHEPLCLRGLKKNEVVVLKKSHQGKINIIENLPNPSDLRVDQLLTSEFFGLNSTMDFETEKQFTRYYELLSIENPTPDELDEISSLSSSLPKKPHLGDTVRDELVYYVIDSLLANEVKNNGLGHFDVEIKEQAKLRTKALWDRLKNDFEK